MADHRAEAGEQAQAPAPEQEGLRGRACPGKEAEAELTSLTSLPRTPVRGRLFCGDKDRHRFPFLLFSGPKLWYSKLSDQCRRRTGDGKSAAASLSGAPGRADGGGYAPLRRRLHRRRDVGHRAHGPGGPRGVRSVSLAGTRGHPLRHRQQRRGRICPGGPVWSWGSPGPSGSRG